MSRNPVENCDHEEQETEYIERSDGQHEVRICSECSLIVEDLGQPEPSNVEEDA